MHAPAHGLVVRVYDASRHSRFLNFPSNPTHNPQFLHAAFDLTGVGWDNANSARQLTLVSPMHFVGANHYKPGVGATIKFLSSGGMVRSYTVADQTAVNNDSGQASDLFIGKLSQPVSPSDEVGYHPYLNLGNESQYLNKDVILLGKSARGAVQTTSTLTDMSSGSTNSTRVVSMVYRTSGFFLDDDEARYESGDSGSPVFISQGGTAAIIGTNSLLGTVQDPITGEISSYVCYANFVPHYADKLNAVMEADGYRMTKAIPGSTTLVLEHQVQAGVVRAGYPFTIDLTVSNTGGTLAENLRLNNSFPNGTTVGSATGTGWFDESTATDIKARKAKLESASATTYSVSLTIPEAGTAQHQVTFSCDQFSVTTETFNIEVVGSFLSFASGLADPSETGDDDLDGIINLLEYVFGGDPRSNSRFLPASTTHLLPVIGKDNGAFSISYIRRTDHVQRAITYALETSGTMGSGTWTDATPFITGTTVSPINAGLEKVTHGLSGVTTSRFFRVKVDVDE